MFKPKKIILHHSAVRIEDNKKQYDAIDAYHKIKGWGGIGYHILIEDDGTIMKGRDEIKEGVHTVGYNDKSFGICLAGNFDIDNPSSKQLEALSDVIRYFRKKYNLEYRCVSFHNEFANKTCPGKNFTKSLLKSLMNLKELVRDQKGGFYFIKEGDNGKQKINLDDSRQSIALLLTAISREFGIKTLTDKNLETYKDKNYV